MSALSDDDTDSNKAWTPLAREGHHFCRLTSMPSRLVQATSHMCLACLAGYAGDLPKACNKLQASIGIPFAPTMLQQTCTAMNQNTPSV